MREEKSHWRSYGMRGMWVSLCGKTTSRFANAKRKVTCISCQKILRGYR